MAQLGQFSGNKQGGYRPVMLWCNSKALYHSNIVHIIPITSQCKPKLPVHVELQDCGLLKKSIALIEQLSIIQKSELGKKVGSVRNTIYEEKIKKAIEIQLDL